MLWDIDAVFVLDQALVYHPICCMPPGRRFRQSETLCFGPEYCEVVMLKTLLVTVFRATVGSPKHHTALVFNP